MHGGATFLVYEDERLTFGEHLEEAAALAWGLADLYGVRKGDRVAVAMRNLPEWVVAFWAGAALGAIVVPLNGWWTGPELAYGLEDSGTKVAVVDPERLARIAPHLDDLRRGGLEQVVVARAGDGPASPGLSGNDRYGAVLAAGRRLGASTDGESSSHRRRSCRRTTPRSSIPRGRRASRRGRSGPSATSARTS